MNSQAFTITQESTTEASWHLPAWFWITFSVAAFVFIFWLYRSERGNAGQTTRMVLVVLRWTLIMLAFWALSGWKVEQFQTEKPALAMVIDRSQSMATADIPIDSESSNTTRMQEIARSIQSIPDSTRRSLDTNYDLRWFTTGKSLLSLSTQSKTESDSQTNSPKRMSEQVDWPDLREMRAMDSSSALGDGLSQLVDRYTGRQAAAIVLLSDGINTSGRSLAEAAKLARASGIPIFAVTYGNELGLPDLRLADLQLESEVYLGDRVTCQVSILASDVEPLSTSVVARRADNGKVLDTTVVQIGEGAKQASARLSFVPEESGTVPIEIEVAAAAGENDTENNVIQQSIQVVDKTLKVLVLQEAPNYEFRFLKHYLERTVQKSASQNVSFEVTSVLQESDPEYVDQDRSAQRLVPTQIEQIAEIDVFVLGRLNPSLVSRRSQQAIYEAVTERGAGCIFIASDPMWLHDLGGWPLGDLLPVVPPLWSRNTVPEAERADDSTRWRWNPTELGLSSPPMLLANSIEESDQIWNELPALDQLCPLRSVKIGAQVLVEATDRGEARPLVVSQYAGAGRVVFQGCTETYRWTSFGGSDLFHQRYWGQLLRWCSRGKLATSSTESQLRIEPASVNAGRPIRIEAYIGTQNRDTRLSQSATVRVQSDGRTPTTVSLQRRSAGSRSYVGTIENLLPGKYEAQLVQPVTPAQPKATFEILAPDGELSELRANVAGMQQLAQESRGKSYPREQLRQLLDDLPTGTAIRVGALPPKPIWNAWWVALTFVALITAEWLLRRRARML